MSDRLSTSSWRASACSSDMYAGVPTTALVPVSWPIVAIIESIVLVTHAYHMARSMRAFEATGLRVVPAPHDWRSGPPGLPYPRDFVPSAQAAQGTWLALHELLGGLWYRLRGHG